jgi:hypothetical protein
VEWLRLEPGTPNLLLDAMTTRQRRLWSQEEFEVTLFSDSMQYSSSDEVKAVVMMMRCSRKFETKMLGEEKRKKRKKKLLVPSIELELPLPDALLLLTWCDGDGLMENLEIGGLWFA